jgi:pimeloyl-ACP methyl ester carboxylesterase
VQQRLQITGPHGRRLDVEVAGPEDARVVIVHTGTPSAGTLFEPEVVAGAARGLRHVAYARPGYAASDRQAGRSVADCAGDVAAIADQLGVERFFTLGASGGGPHALACAALLAERVLAAATIGGVAPFGAEGLDWTAGMGQENLDEFAAMQAGEEQLLAYLQREAADIAGLGGAELGRALQGLLSDVDRSALTGDFAEYLAASMHAALANGVWGWFDDDVAHMSDWGFDLPAISRPVTVWQGEQDRFVPFAHGEWLVRHIPGARPQLRPQDGHLSISVSSYGEVLDELVASAA